MTRTTESSTGRRIGRSCTRKTIGDAAQPFQRLGFVGDDRLVAAVAAGRDDRKAKLAQQQMMQRRIGQHDAEPGIAGRDAGRDQRRTPAVRAAARWAPRRSTAAAPPRPTVPRARVASASDGTMMANGLRGRRFARAQPAHRASLRGIDQQLEAAQPLQRDDPPCAQRRRPPPQAPHAGRDTALPARIPQRQLRAAIRAGIGFGMKAAASADRHIPPGRRHTSENAASSCGRGRRAAASMML